MFRKILAILCIGCVALTASFANGASEAKAAGGAPSIKRISIGTAGTAGSLYPMGVGMAKTITDHVDGIACTGEATAASVENIRNLTNGKLAMGISQSEIAYLAYNGLGDFKGHQATDLRALFSTITSYIQAFALAGSGINSIADFKGKVVGCSAAGSGGEMCVRMILNYYGLTYDDIKPQFISESDAVSALKDGRIDAFICTHPLKSAPLVDLTTSAKVKMFSFDDPAFYKEFFFWKPYTIPAGFYDGVNEAITVPTSRITMCTSTKSGLSDEQVYQIVKAIWDNRSEWSGVAKSVSTQAVFATATDGIPIVMHPGAVRYFKEKGVEIDPSLIPQN
ncbi:MAG: TAXI family TRAP transporter solute-binding subunit [Spirochaetia bacterium]|jgi:TRAP transporter TAXI family solute receptor|nr:TAXI family TRAP transporter solute-binding subunit [Spirochaetia bacterium]